MRKLGLIAGGGDLPVALAHRCRSQGRSLFVLRLQGLTDPALVGFDGADVGVAQLGKGIAALRAAGCEAVCMAGVLARPDLAALKPDLRGIAALPGAIAAARKGDDALLQFLLGEFEKEGFTVEGAHEVMGDLLLPGGALGALKPSASDRLDISRALEVARIIGGLDVGQGAVCCHGLILAVEAQEGTDAMLRRVADLPEAIRGRSGAPRGALVKAPKPGQDLRIDLPTIGAATVRLAAAAGLSGLAGEAGAVLVIDQEAVRALADSLGVFVYGILPED